MEAIPQTFLQEPVFRNLGKVARYAALNESDKIAYKASLKAYRDAYAIAETERSEGRAEGRAEEKYEMAKNLKKLGCDINMIAKASGLSLEVIESL